MQNSWGEEWGDNGYARVSLGQELMFDQYAYSIKIKADKASDVKTTKTKKPEPSADLEDME